MSFFSWGWWWCCWCDPITITIIIHQSVALSRLSLVCFLSVGVSLCISLKKCNAAEARLTRRCASGVGNENGNGIAIGIGIGVNLERTAITGGLSRPAITTSLLLTPYAHIPIQFHSPPAPLELKKKQYY